MRLILAMLRFASGIRFESGAHRSVFSLERVKCWRRLP